MELPTKPSKQIGLNKRPKLEEHTLFVMDKSTDEEHLSHPLRTKNKQPILAVTFLTDYSGIVFVKNKNFKFIFMAVFEKTEYNVVQEAYEIQSLNGKIERIIIEEGFITKEDYPFTFKPNFSNLGSVIGILPERRWQIGFVQDDSLRDILGSRSKTIQIIRLSSRYFIVW